LYSLNNAGFYLRIHQRLTRNAPKIMAIAPMTPIIIVVRGIPSTGATTVAGGMVCVSLGVIATGDGVASVTETPTGANVVGTGVLVPIVVPPFWYTIAKYEKPGVVTR
jgi:hypothetical protein